MPLLYLPQLKFTLESSYYRLEMCMGMDKTGISWDPWDSHANGNTISHGMGIGIRWMGMGIKTLEWENV